MLKLFTAVSISLAIFILAVSATFAGQIIQDSTEQKSDSSKLSTGFFNVLGFDFCEQAQAPFAFGDKSTAYLVGAISLTTVALIAADEPVDKVMRTVKSNSTLISKYDPYFTELGGKYGYIGSLGFGGYSLLWNDKKAQETSVLLAQTLITSGVWVRTIKLIAGRERPSAAYNGSQLAGGKWTPFGQIFIKNNQGVASFDAFPSGHTATAFSIATIFAEQYADKPAVPIIAYSTAGLIAVSRLVEHEHWISDVFLGGCIGYYCSKQLVNHFRSIQERNGKQFVFNEKNSLEFSFFAQPNAAGLTVGIQANW